jgi:hypothetical protein
MSVKSLFSLFALVTLSSASTVACAASNEAGDGESGAADLSAGSSQADSLGCGDGKKSAPNAWFMSAQKSDSTLFKAVALMSSNLFSIDSITADNPSQDVNFGFPADTSNVTDLIFEVSFTPGRDSLALPHVHEDSIKNRDAVLTQLKELGATVECNNILQLRPLTAHASVAETVDSVGCGDGTKSAPNGWFISLPKNEGGALFQEIALMGSNLFRVTNVTAVNPALESGSLAFPTDVSKTSSLVFLTDFTPGVNSLAFPKIAQDSITYRDQTLLALKKDGLAIECNNILHTQH